jgi:hypothetical protein
MGVLRVVRSEGRMEGQRVGPRAVRSEDRMEGRKEDLMGVPRAVHSEGRMEGRMEGQKEDRMGVPRAVRSEGLVPQVGEVEVWKVLQEVLVAAWAAWAALLEERSTARVLFLAQGLGSLQAA